MKQRKKSVFFLGAGCSAAFGYPVTSLILKIILDQAKEGRLFSEVRGNNLRNERLKEKQLKNYIEDLFPGIKGVNEYESSKLPGITEVLSLTDYFIEMNIVPKGTYNPDDMLHCRRLLHRAICEVLYRKPRELYQLERINEDLKRFLDLLVYKAGTTALTIITTNYDTLIELLLLRRLYFPVMEDGDAEEPIQIKKFNTLTHFVDFGTNYRDPFENRIITQPNKPLFRLLKLHGSFTWLKCDLCEHIFVNPWGDIVFQAYRDRIDHNNLCFCNDHLQLRTLIVAPSIVRDIKDPNLLHIWKNSLEALRAANEWNIIGYSMPAEDLMIKTLFMRALNGASKTPEITVVQLDDTFQNNFKALFPKHRFISGGVTAYLNTLKPVKPSRPEMTAKRRVVLK